MLQSALIMVAVGGGVVAQAYPDELDILRGADTTPQIQLVLDTSCSMGFGPITNGCSHYYTQVLNNSPLAGNPMTRLELLKAVLTGCQTANDGIFDTWADQVIFSVREFGGSGSNPRLNVVAEFFGSNQPTDDDGIPTGSSLTVLETAVETLSPSGGTPLALAYREAGEYFASEITNSNSRHCRQNFIVLMSDGDGNQSNNSNPVDFDFINPPGVTHPPVSIKDTNGNFQQPDSNSGSYTSPYADAAAEYMVRDSSGNVIDALPLLDNTTLPSGGERGQPIRTYTIGFDPPADADALLDSMALYGEGQSYTADSYETLDNAFNSIISDIVPRSQVAFSPGSVQTDGLFSGNYLYAPTFQPVAAGHWYGTVKKHCVMPANPTDAKCLFKYDGDDLVTNAGVVDLWTNTAALDATVGGTGQQIFDQVFGVSGPSANVPPSPYSYRNIVTWRPGQSGYVQVDDSASLTNIDTQSGNRCEHFRLINKLHGYAPEVTDCSANDFTPTGFDTWPQGDTVHGSVVLLKYSKECETTSSVCYVLANANDGMLHVFRARDGRELSAVIPGELWRTNDVANNRLRDIMDQPHLDELKRFYFDGGMRLFHDDRNVNGYIDGTEKAYIVAGLGRGGRGYYLWDVSSFNGDFSSNSAPAPHPLLVDEATGFKDLRDTWAAPWMGLYRDSSGSYRRVAVFASGHQRQLDQDNAAFAEFEAALPSALSDTESSPYSATCSDFGIDPAFCNPFPAGCKACNDAAGVAAGCPALGPGEMYCYDFPGYAGTSSAPPFNNINSQLGGHVIPFPPIEWTLGTQRGDAYRVVFSKFQLQEGVGGNPPHDRMEFMDEDQNVIGRLEGNAEGSVSPCPGVACSPWIYSPKLNVRFLSDGEDLSDVDGWTVDSIQVIRRNGPPQSRAPNSSPTPGPKTRPSVYIVDLDLWAALPPFGARPTGNDDRQSDPLLVRFTASCDGVTGSTETCIDATSQSDLQFMKCPISGELPVYQEGSVFRTIYAGDECGQIWKFDQDPVSGWVVKRLLRLNNADGSGEIFDNRPSRDYRKIFTRLELVLSRCNGARSIGVYFGTGNVQRSGISDVLTDSSLVRATTTGELQAGSPGPSTGLSGPGISKDGDVFGVVWDSPNLETPADGLSLEDLVFVNKLPLVGPSGRQELKIENPTAGDAVNGFFIEVGQGQKMLRNPVVFDGVASFKIYSPFKEATECLSAVGSEFLYQFDNCDASAFVDTDIDSGNAIGDTVGDRITWEGFTDIGTGLLIFTPPSGDAFLSMADTTAATEARLPSKPNSRGSRMFLWRTYVDDN